MRSAARALRRAVKLLMPKAHEDSLRSALGASLVEGLPDGVMAVDRHGRVLLVNGSLLAMARPDVCVGRAVDDLLLPDAPGPAPWWTKSCPRPFEGVLRTAKEVRRVRVAVAAHLDPLYDALVCVVQDVEARRRLEDAAAARAAQAEAGVEVRDALLRIASHQLRSPLSGAIMETWSLAQFIRELALDDATRGELRERIVEVGRRMEGLGRLVQNLLDTSRIQGGRLVLSLAPFDLAAVARSTAARFAGDAAARGTAIEVLVPVACPVRLDRVRVEQMIGNLLDNAVTHGGGAPVRVEVGLEGRWVYLAVSDLGPGVPLAEHEAVFEGVDRVLRGSSPGRGLGVGLWVVRQLARMLGGDARVDPAWPTGARVVVRLPAGT